MSSQQYVPIPDEDVKGSAVIFNHEVPQLNVPWRTGLLDCFQDCELCCLGTFCGPCLYGQNVATMQVMATGQPASCTSPCLGYYCSAFLPAFFAGFTMGTLSTGGFVPVDPALVQPVGKLAGNCGIGVYAGATRADIRRKFGIKGSDTCDCMTHFCCSPCALCQEAREIKHQLADLEAVADTLIANSAPLPPTMVYAEEFKTVA